MPDQGRRLRQPGSSPRRHVGRRGARRGRRRQPPPRPLHGPGLPLRRGVGGGARGGGDGVAGGPGVWPGRGTAPGERPARRLCLRPSPHRGRAAAPPPGRPLQRGAEGAGRPPGRRGRRRQRRPGPPDHEEGPAHGLPHPGRPDRHHARDRLPQGL